MPRPRSARSRSSASSPPACIRPTPTSRGPERYATDKSYFPDIQQQGRKTFELHLKQIDERLARRQWLSDAYSTLDPYAFTFYTWGVRREIPMAEMKNFTAHKDRMLARPAVRRIVEDEKVKV